MNAQGEWNPSKQGVGDLTEGPGPGNLVPEKFRGPIPIVGKFFTIDEFSKYVRDVVVPAWSNPAQWKPKFIVLHNTAVPSLAQRPNGFTRANMDSLAYYFGVEQGWHAGPAAFVDQKGIWVFSGFLLPGVHSPSWNTATWGIEQLGDFAKEEYNSGDGAKVRDNAIAVMAILSKAAHMSAASLKFHYEDRKTTHACPGAKCKKLAVVSLLSQKMAALGSN